MHSVPPGPSGTDVRQAAVEAIGRRLGLSPVPDGFCLIVLENMDLVEVSGAPDAGAALRARVCSEIAARLGPEAMLSNAREDGFLIALPAGDRLVHLADLHEILHALPFWKLDALSHGTSVTGRAGLVWLDPGPRPEPLEIYRAAVTAASAARSSQRVCVVYGTPDGAAITDLERTAQLICDLPAAVSEDRLFLLAQEIVSTAPGAARGREYEVLLQMHSRNGQSYAPGYFLQAAEQSRLIEIIDHWVLRKVLVGHAPALLARPEISVSINIAARTLSNPDFVPLLQTVLDEGGLPAARLQLEITETAQIRDLKQAQANTRAARAMGCRIALDDFGVGMSGYGYLKTFEPHCLKIDGSLIPMVADPTSIDARIVRSVVELAHDLGVEVVAEHVSTPEIFEALKRLGVDKVQGFQLGRPGPFESVFDPGEAQP